MRFIDRCMEKGRGKTVSVRERENEKRIMLYRWLHEFRVVDVFIVSRLFGISRQACQLYLQDMTAKGLLAEGNFRFAHGTRKVYCLLKPGFDDWKRREDVSGKYITQTRILKSSLLSHHLCVQHSLLDMVSMNSEFQLGNIEALWEHNLPKEWLRRPDAMMVFHGHDAQGEKLAVRAVCEFELTEKSRERVFWIFQAHMEAMDQGKYLGVYWYFIDEKILKAYLALLNEPQWPLMRWDKREGKARHVFEQGKPKIIEPPYAKKARFFFYMSGHESLQGLK